LWVQRTVSALWLVSGIVDVSMNHGKGTGWLSIVGGCLYGAIALQQKAMLFHVSPGVQTTIRFSEAEIVFEQPTLQTLPWNALDGIAKYDGGLLLFFDKSAVKSPLEQRLAIPNRALGDDGVALWSLSERMMLGPLRRLTDQLSVDERGSVRRNDGEWIPNLRAFKTRSPARAKLESLPWRSA
jgi:hypothetical protein